MNFGAAGDSSSGAQPSRHRTGTTAEASPSLRPSIRDSDRRDQEQVEDGRQGREHSVPRETVSPPGDQHMRQGQSFCEYISPGLGCLAICILICMPRNAGYHAWLSAMFMLLSSLCK